MRSSKRNHVDDNYRTAPKRDKCRDGNACVIQHQWRAATIKEGDLKETGDPNNPPPKILAQPPLGQHSPVIRRARCNFNTMKMATTQGER